MPAPLIACADPRRLDELLRLAAAAGVDPQVARDASAARRAWTVSPVVLVGDDLAADLVAARLPRRAHVALVGVDLDDATVWQRGMALGAENVVFLPDAEAWLVDQLARCVDPASDGLVVAVLPGHGGAGATTLAAALAVSARRLGHAAVLVDGDPLGGGLDVVLGAEAAPGARWPEVLAARGALADVVPHALPTGQGVPVLSWDRGEPAEVAPGAVADVVDVARRTSRLVVLDLPRADGDVAEACSVADLVIVVTLGEVRAAAAAARVATVAARHCPDLRLVVRGPSPVGLTPEVVSEAVGLRLVGALRSDGALAGELPVGFGGGGRSHLARFAAEVVRDLLDEPWRRRVDAA